MESSLKKVLKYTLLLLAIVSTLVEGVLQHIGHDSAENDRYLGYDGHQLVKGSWWWCDLFFNWCCSWLWGGCCP